ncbi:MAG TPA: hypothetical protein VGJ32_00515 [Solirubrobacteraceae bacterium]|jgi:hypothetical protein
MKPRRTVVSNTVFALQGATEDSDLWARVYAPGEVEDGEVVVGSVWELTDDERAAIADGANVELLVWGGQPPVALRLSNYRLGKPPAPEEDT